MARDYQLVAKFYRENPIVQIGGNNKISPTKISNQVKAAMKGEGPRQELMDSLRPLTQFYTAQEFGQGGCPHQSRLDLFVIQLKPDINLPFVLVENVFTIRFI